MPRNSVESVRGRAYQELVELIVEAHRQSGLTQAEVCRRLGKPRSYFGKVTSAERRLDVVEFFEIVLAMGADPLALLTVFGSKMRGNGSNDGE